MTTSIQGPGASPSTTSGRLRHLDRVRRQPSEPRSLEACRDHPFDRGRSWPPFSSTRCPLAGRAPRFLRHVGTRIIIMMTARSDPDSLQVTPESPSVSKTCRRERAGCRRSSDAISSMRFLVSLRRPSWRAQLFGLRPVEIRLLSSRCPERFNRAPIARMAPTSTPVRLADRMGSGPLARLHGAQIHLISPIGVTLETEGRLSSRTARGNGYVTDQDQVVPWLSSSDGRYPSTFDLVRPLP